MTARSRRLAAIAFAATGLCTLFDAAFARAAPALANPALAQLLVGAGGFASAAIGLRVVRRRMVGRFTLSWLPTALAVAEEGAAILAFYGWMPAAITVAGWIVLPASLPLADPWLAAADAAIGVTHPDVWGAAVALGLVPALSLAYDSVAWVLPAVLVYVVAIRREAERAWAYVAAVAVAGVASLAPLWALPAVGPRAYLGAEAYGVPPEAPLWVAAIEALRDGRPPPPAHAWGLLTFPSFHVVFAVLLARAVHGTPLGPLGAVWAGVVTVSAVPIGSHYVVDAIAGALWAFAAVLFVERAAGEPHPPVG